MFIHTYRLIYSLACKISASLYTMKLSIFSNNKLLPSYKVPNLEQSILALPDCLGLPSCYILEQNHKTVGQTIRLSILCWTNIK